MNTNAFQEAFALQNAQLEAAMKQLEAMGDVDIFVSEEALAEMEAACQPRPRALTCPGVRA
jgi:hypothetical protein